MHVPLTQIEYESMKSNKPNPKQAEALVRNSLAPEMICAIQILNIGFWNLSAEQALEYSKGRIVLCGDSAHSMPPAGGFGMNTGIEDAQNLAHKLNLINKLDLQHNSIIIQNILQAYSVERRYIGRSYINQSVINYEKNLQTAKSLGLDASNLHIADKLVSLLPFGGKSNIMGTLKTIGSLHLDANIWKKKLNADELLQLNFFDLETTHKIPLVYTYKEFEALYSGLNSDSQFEGSLLKNCKIDVAGTGDNIASKQLWSFLANMANSNLPYIMITNIKEAAEYTDVAFVLVENEDHRYYLVNSSLSLELENLRRNYVNDKTRYLIIVRSDSYIERVMVN